MDRDELRQVLANLAENARQAMPDGGTLTVTCEEPTRGRLRIRVCDTGCGIQGEKLPRIFDAFYSTKDNGTGLGLAVVKRIVEAAGGTVRAESTVGRGTCIEVQLPSAVSSERDGPSRGGEPSDGAAR
jgi:signal transduction histidine kinase